MNEEIFILFNWNFTVILFKNNLFININESRKYFKIKNFSYPHALLFQDSWNFQIKKCPSTRAFKNSPFMKIFRSSDKIFTRKWVFFHQTLSKWKEIRRYNYWDYHPYRQSYTTALIDEIVPGDSPPPVPRPYHLFIQPPIVENLLIPANFNLPTKFDCLRTNWQDRWKFNSSLVQLDTVLDAYPEESTFYLRSVIPEWRVFR